MHLAELEPAAPDRIDLGGKRLLIFIVAYNAATTIEKVLNRIPRTLQSQDVEILIIDDSSKDDTFLSGLRYQQRYSAFKITVLRTPQNQGYGGNQKLGYRYAIDNGIEHIKTWNDVHNKAMLSINEAMGFAKQPAWVSYEKDL